MTPTVKFTLAAACVVGAAIILRQTSRGPNRPSAISEALEHEDHLFDAAAADEEAALFDDRIAPGAPL
jgi:hypothetical protein